MSPLLTSSQPGAVLAAARAKQSSDNPAANALLSVYGQIPPGGDGQFLKTDLTNPLGFGWSASVSPLYTAVLPAGVDGLEIYFIADAANGVIWHLRFNAGSASAFKWEVLGGGELFSAVDTDEATASAAYGDLATVGPSVVVPLAGDYEEDYRSETYNTTNGAAAAFYSPNGVVGDEAVVAVSSLNNTFLLSRQIKKTIAAPATVTMKYKTSAGAGHWLKRTLRMRPIRVG